MSLGEFKETEFTLDDRSALLPKLQELYRTAADPGLHASAEWLLRRWKQEAWLTQVNDEWAKDAQARERKIAAIKELVRKDKEKTPPQWYVNTQGQALVVIPGPVEFVMGAPSTEFGWSDEQLQHKRRIGRTFALAAKPVTVEEYRKFDKDYTLSANYTRMPNLPAVGIDWYSGAKYSNWLSEQEGIPPEQWCYEITGNEIKLRPNYLSLDGYRLPTEAEMEYGTRSGSSTSRYYGETDELLPQYAWYIRNSQEKTWPVGSLKPCDLGLFDVQGNVFTWCQESFKNYPGGVIEDQEDELEIVSTKSRALRGGSWFNHSSLVRSASRSITPPISHYIYIGFRVARTMTLASDPR